MMKCVPLSEWISDFHSPLIIAGPCSAESREQVLETARLLAIEKKVKIFRAGIWKPRTRPNSFEGAGAAALPWLAEVKKTYGLMAATEVASAEHVELCLNHGIDLLWLGARTTASPFAVQEIADSLKGSNVAVAIKNPVGPDLPTWIGAIERISQAGINKIMAIHRGFTHLGGITYRNDPIWKMAIDLKARNPHLPVICDPSHIAGRRDLIMKVCQKALDIDLDGLMIETHPNPDQALSDALQQVTPYTLHEILNKLDYKKQKSNDSQFEFELEQFRAQIDRIDREIIESLSLRQKIVEKIGEQKQKLGITALQKQRMASLLEDRIRYGETLGLAKEFVEEIFHGIHTESVRIQSEIMEKTSKKDQK